MTCVMSESFSSSVAAMMSRIREFVVFAGLTEEQCSKSSWSCRPETGLGDEPCGFTFHPVHHTVRTREPWSERGSYPCPQSPPPPLKCIRLPANSQACLQETLMVKGRFKATSCPLRFRAIEAFRPHVVTTHIHKNAHCSFLHCFRSETSKTQRTGCSLKPKSHKGPEM